MTSTPGTRAKLDDHLLVETRGGVALITLNRPEKLNALTPDMVSALCNGVEELGEDLALTGLVFTGEGRAFCAGADIWHQSQAEGDARLAFIQAIQNLTRILRRSRLLVVAALNGIAVGGGLELALACDRRVASPGTLVGFPEVKLGVTVTSGVTHMLPRMVGTSRAIELLVSGRSIDANEALALGLIDDIADDAVAAAVHLASAAQAAPTGLVQMIKNGVYSGADSTLEEALADETRAIMDAYERPEARDPMHAFLERHDARSRETKKGQDDG